MKLDEKNKEHLALVAKYLSKEMDENEQADFEIDVALEPDNQALLNEIKGHWNMLDKYNNKKRIDTEQAWSKLNDRFLSEDLIPAQQEKKHTAVGLIQRWAIAASVAAVAVVAATILWPAKQNSSEKIVSILNSNSGNTVIETLADGSIIYLNNNTTFAYPQKFSSKERKVDLKGEAFFDIARNPNKPFIIETADATVEVLGTAFNIRTYSKGNFELIVERGKVKVTPKNNPENPQFVTVGERVVISNHTITKSKWEDDGSLQWRTGHMQFKDESLKNIINVINRNYNAQISIPSDEVANRKLTVTFNNNTLNDMVQLICLSMELESIQKGTQIELKEKYAN